MLNHPEKILQVQPLIIGLPDFTRRIAAFINSNYRAIKPSTATFSEAWGIALSERPNIIIAEIGIGHQEKNHNWLRQFLTQLRERFSQECYICLAVTACEKLMYAGDLLFSEEKLTPSGLVDTFVITPPAAIPSIPTIEHQLLQVMEFFSVELERRNSGKLPLPALGTFGWAQSIVDPKSRELWMRWLPRYASYTNENPIIIGETGTGKTNLAYALHLLSGQSGKFISITPRDFSSSELVQAELFGAVAGAYTGAVDKWGLVRSAEKGTLFIDELQSIDKELQGKLITFIENKIYRRVGSAETIEADVRFVFAANRTLSDMMRTEVLRDDFAYRLERVQLELLPLRFRRLDIAGALAFALAKISRQRPQNRSIVGLSSGSYRILFSQNWPGNLRQLENTVAQLCELSDMRGRVVIDEEVVATVFSSSLSGTPHSTQEILSHAAGKLTRQILKEQVSDLNAGIEKFSDLARLEAIEAAAGDLKAASQLLGESEAALELFRAGMSLKRNRGSSL